MGHVALPLFPELSWQTDYKPCSLHGLMATGKRTLVGIHHRTAFIVNQTQKFEYWELLNHWIASAKGPHIDASVLPTKGSWSIKGKNFTLISLLIFNIRYSYCKAVGSFF